MNDERLRLQGVRTLQHHPRDRTPLRENTEISGKWRPSGRFRNPRATEWLSIQAKGFGEFWGAWMGVPLIRVTLCDDTIQPLILEKGKGTTQDQGFWEWDGDLGRMEGSKGE